MKFIEYFFSAVSVVSSNHCVGYSPRIEISFFFLSTCTEGFISSPKIIAFLPNPIAPESFTDLPKPIFYVEYSYL